jgi:glycosyltransferase involved in cell wall biosynthesis
MNVAEKVCFLGGSRYGRPLDATTEKKFRAMGSLAKIFVVGFSRDLQWRRFTEHARFYLLPQLPLPALRYLELLVLGQFLLLWLIARHRIQIVVAQSPYEGFVAALAIRVARFFGYDVKLVAEIHGDFEESLFLQREIKRPGLYRFVMSQVARYSIHQVDVLRVISNATKEQIRRWAPEKTIVQFPAWTDIETFLRSTKTSKEGAENVLYAGVLTPLKGIHHLIGAFAVIAAEFPDAQLTIIGKTENQSYTAELLRQVQKHGLEMRVRFMAAISQAELAVWMANSSALVLPSLSEGLGRVIIEAMATGTPVIGSEIGGIPELVEDGITGLLVPAGDEAALAGKLRWILQNPGSARAMGIRARVFAEKFFSTSGYLEGYKRIFEVALMNTSQGEHATASF